MMTHTITLNLPEPLYQPLWRMAQATHQTIETVLLTALQTSLPSLEGLPPDWIEELHQLEKLDNATLQQILLATFPGEPQHELEILLQNSQHGVRTETTQQRLELLQTAAAKLMLRKARAAVLLRFRGQRLPTLVELRQLTTSV